MHFLPWHPSTVSSHIVWATISELARLEPTCDQLIWNEVHSACAACGEIASHSPECTWHRANELVRDFSP